MRYLSPSVRRFQLLIALLLAAVLGGAPACTRTQSPVLALRIQLPTDPASLDPALAEDGASLRVLYNTMDGLVGYDGSGRLRNLLAESFVVSKDGKNYDFKLRPGALWSDGKPVQAQDFAVGILRALSPASGSKLAGIFFPIHGARAFFEGKAPAEAVGIRVEAGHLIIELDHAAPYFVQALSLPVAMPERQDVLVANGGRWPDVAPCTGPYRITRHQAERRIHFERNPRYWAPVSDAPEVEMLIVEDESTALNLFDRGKIDILTKIPATELPRLGRQGVLHRDVFLATYYLSFNFHKPPFNDRVLRQAVSGSIQREELVRALDSGEIPASGWIPRGLEGYVPYVNPARTFSTSIVAARKHGVPTQTLGAAFDTSHRNTLVMEKVQHDLKSALGLKLSLNNLDWKTYLKTVQTDPPPLFRLGILSPFLDPIQILESFTTGNPNNYLKWSNAEYDRLVAEIGALSPGRERESKIRRAQVVMVEEEAIVVPLYHYVQNHAVSKRVENFHVNSFGVIRFDELRMAR